MKNIVTIMLLGILPVVQAQLPNNVNKIDATPNEVTKVKGKLENGVLIEDLSWASSSAVACFPGTQNSKFTGKHDFHMFEIPPYSEVTITLIPDDKSANFSLYGYQVGTSSYPVPPNLSQCVSCEADHKWDYPKRGKTQDHTRSIFFNSIKNGYNIFVSASGANGLDKGGYTLEIDLKSRVENTSEQKKLKIYSVSSQKGKVVTVTGDLSEGVKIQDLSWASTSSMACFPATQNQKFTGNHLFFVTEIPPRSEMTVTVIPDNKKANFSLYGYQDGTTNDAYPPNVQSCVSCEADHKWDYPKRGKTQDHSRTIYFNSVNNPYRIVIGVVGADGLTEGTFKLQITLK